MHMEIRSFGDGSLWLLFLSDRLLNHGKEVFGFHSDRKGIAGDIIRNIRADKQVLLYEEG